MITEEQAHELAEQWVNAWNSHDLEAIMSHYDEEIVLVSPIAAKLLNDPSGTVKGKPALQAYFSKGLEAYPDLKFEIINVMWGLFSILLHYSNQRGIKAGEFMEISSTGKIIKVVANYNR